MLTKTLSLKAAYKFGIAHGLETEIRDIRDMAIEWDLNYTSTLRRGYIIHLFEKNGIFEEFKKECWPFGNTPKGEGRKITLLKIKDRYEAFVSNDGEDPDNETDDQSDIEEAQGVEFALEAHLRDFLAKNLERIEPGLRLHTTQDNSGVEFPIDGGRIDLFAVDKNQKYVVIELKLSRGRNKTLGQILYYMGWVDKNLGKGPCRGIIIASDITDDLALAITRVSGISLAKYQMNFSIEPIKF